MATVLGFLKYALWAMLVGLVLLHYILEVQHHGIRGLFRIPPIIPVLVLVVGATVAEHFQEEAIRNRDKPKPPRQP